MTDAVDAIGSIRKARGQEVRVALSEFHGTDLIDIRIFADFDGGDVGMRATQKGVSLRVEHLPALAGLIDQALERARDRGLIPHVA